MSSPSTCQSTLFLVACLVLAGGCAFAAGEGAAGEGAAGEGASGEGASAAPIADGRATGDDFARYRESACRRLEAKSLPRRTPADVALNLPFERMADPAVPYRGRFLLLHGLNDSAGVWHDFADELVARGFDVRAPLFEGHGSTPEAMLEVDWSSWLADARRWRDAWSTPGDTTPLYLGGFSMGGVLATLLALDGPPVAGLLLLSPAYRSSLDRWLRFAGLYARFRPWMFGGMIREDNPIKYNSIPINSGWQFHRATRALTKRWRPDDRIDVPTLMVLSSEDSVVDVDHSRRLFRQRFTHASRRLLTYAPDVGTGDTRVTGATYAEIASDLREQEEVRDSRYPEFRILGQSHLSLTNAPANTRFGERGSVLVCNGNEWPVFSACLRARKHWYGAQHAPSPDGVPVARVTWNPDWQHVLRRFDETLMAAPPPQVTP